jgi:hypothetical protein
VLMWSVRNRHTATTTLLLDTGANVNLADKVSKNNTVSDRVSVYDCVCVCVYSITHSITNLLTDLLAHSLTHPLTH